MKRRRSSTETSTEPRGNLISFLHPRYLIMKYPWSLHCFASLLFFFFFKLYLFIFLFSRVSSEVDGGQLSRVTEEEDKNSKQESSALHRNKDKTCAVAACIII